MFSRISNQSRAEKKFIVPLELSKVHSSSDNASSAEFHVLKPAIMRINDFAWNVLREWLLSKERDSLFTNLEVRLKIEQVTEISACHVLL
jgi:hypothetical protein